MQPLKDEVDAWVDFQAGQQSRGSRLADAVLAVAIALAAVWCLLEYLEPCATSVTLCAVVGMPGLQRRRAAAHTLGQQLLARGAVQHYARPGLLERVCRRYVRWCERRRLAALQVDVRGYYEAGRP